MIVTMAMEKKRLNHIIRAVHNRSDYLIKPIIKYNIFIITSLREDLALGIIFIRCRLSPTKYLLFKQQLLLYILACLFIPFLLSLTIMI